MEFKSRTIIFLPRIALILLINFSTLSYTFCQDGNQDRDRPKIGLVLSGGGAKGVAHIGVIKYLEQAGIRPDYIAGTSMGSIVGGLYAMGYSAEEMEKIVLSIDWSLVVSNLVGFEDISFEEKEYYNRYLVELPIIDWKLSLPSGLIEGQKLSQTLHYYTWPANNIPHFDSLPIPFRAITTDVKTGKAIVQDRGYLHNALRASLAIPTFFTPFDKDSTLVVDGGVVNNFPVDVVKEMGADIVIGINVGDEDFLDPKEIGTFSGILMQIAMAQSYSKLRENIANCDIYIKPDLGNYSTASFSRYKEILELGKKAGELHFPRFQELSEDIGMFVSNEGIGLEVKPILVSDVQFLGNKLFSDVLLNSKLDIYPGDTVTRDDLERGITRVFGINGFKSVDYSLLRQKDQSYHLIIRAVEKPANLLFASVHYDNIFSAGILLNLTMRDFLGKSSRTVFITDISRNPKFRIDYYKYIGLQKRLAFFGRAEFLNQQTPEFENGSQVDLAINRERRLFLNLMTTQSLKETYLFGPFYENNRISSKFDLRFPEGVRSFRQDFFGVRFLYYRNSLNDRNFATAGSEGIYSINFRSGNNYGLRLESGVDSLAINIDGQTILVPSELVQELVRGFQPNGFLNTYVKYYKFFPVSDKLQIVPTVATGLTFSNESRERLFHNYALGGYQRVRFDDTRVWGLNYRELFVPNFINAGFELQYMPNNNLFLRFGTNGTGYADHIPISEFLPEIFNGFFRDNFLVGYGAEVTFKTLLGPITGGISSNSRDNTLRYYLSIGYSFGYSDR